MGTTDRVELNKLSDMRITMESLKIEEGSVVVLHVPDDAGSEEMRLAMEYGTRWLETKGWKKVAFLAMPNSYSIEDLPHHIAVEILERLTGEKNESSNTNDNAGDDRYGSESSSEEAVPDATGDPTAYPER